MNITLGDAFTLLLGERHFYAAVANGFQRVAVPGMGTMGVGLRNGRIMFFYDPEWIKTLSLPMFIFVLEHEMIHVVMDHIPRYMELLAQFTDEGKRKRANGVFQIAVDCATNELLREHKHFAQTVAETEAMGLAARRKEDPEALPHPMDGPVLPEKFDLPHKMSFEFYQHELMSRVTDSAGGSLGKTTNEDLYDLIMEMLEGDLGKSHDRWNDDNPDGKSKSGEGGKESPGKGGSNITPAQLRGGAEQLRAQIKRTLKKVVNDFQKSRGTIPGEVSQWLTEYLADPVVPWFEVLTSRIQASKRTKDERGIEQPNRSLLALSEEDPSISAAIGTIVDPRWRIFMMVDTSGSQSDDDLEIGFSELEHLMKVDDDIEIRVIQGDAAIHSDVVYKSGDKISREVFGRGGTSFNSYFEYMQKYMHNDETAPDMVIVYTDGYGETIEPQYRFPPEICVLWLLTPHNSTHAIEASGYGDIIIRDPSHAKLWRPHK